MNNFLQFYYDLKAYRYTVTLGTINTVALINLSSLNINDICTF